MRVLIDRTGLQARHHLRDHQRLSALITELISHQVVVLFSSPPELRELEVNACDVLMITTRARAEDDYTSQEIEVVRNFIANGGGLLLMSNHADWPSKNPNNLSKYDAKFLTEFGFGLTFEQTFFRNKEDGERTFLPGSLFNQDHPIIMGGLSGKSVRTIVTNTCCSIKHDRGDCIVSLSNEMVDKRNGLSPSGRCFAHALDGRTHLNPFINGRVVSIADSGFIGTLGTSYPGPGLIGYGDNLGFIRNVIDWLADDQP